MDRDRDWAGLGGGRRGEIDEGLEMGKDKDYDRDGFYGEYER